MKSKLFIRFALVMSVSSGALFAADITWDGGGDGSSWNDGANWDNGGADGVPGSADNISNMVGANVDIDGYVANIQKMENGGITGGSLTIENGGSLIAGGTIEVNRRNGGGSLLVDGSSVSGAVTTFITHYADNDTDGITSEGTLEVKNGGTYSTNNFRSDGGVSNLIISGAGSSVTALSGNNTFANNDAAVNHFTMTDGALTTNGRDYWGGAGSTMDISGGTYRSNSDQLGLSHRAGGDMTVTLSGTAKISSDSTVYMAHALNASTTVNQTGGTFEATHISRDIQFATVAGSSTDYTISGGSLTTARNLDMNNIGTSTFTVDGVGATIAIGKEFLADSATTTVEFVLGATGVSIVDVGTNLKLTNSNLKVDLSTYDVINGTALQLFGYRSTGSGGLTGTFATVDFTGGSGTIDYATADSVWLRDIVVVPESSSALLGALGALALLRRRRQ